MRKKLTFKLNCDETSAAERIAAAANPHVEKGTCSGDRVRLYMMREHKGMRYVEYVFDGQFCGDSLMGDMTPPRVAGDRPSGVKIVLLTILALCVFAAVFGALYLFVLVFSRNIWLSLYIALPAFAALFGGIGLIAFLLRRKKKQVEHLKEFLGDLIVADEKNKKK